MAKELARISAVVGKAGNVRQRASLPSASGDWLACIESVNTLVTDLVQPNTEVARVIGAVAKGDLSQAMALEIDDRPLTGEFLRTADSCPPWPSLPMRPRATPPRHSRPVSTGT